MTQDLVIDLIKVLGPSVIGYLAWITQTVIKQKNDLDSAFYKIRRLENELDRGDDR